MCLWLSPLPAFFEPRRHGARTTGAIIAGDLVFKEGAIGYTCRFLRKTMQNRADQCHVNVASQGSAFALLLVVVFGAQDANPRVITGVCVLESAPSKAVLVLLLRPAGTVVCSTSPWDSICFHLCDWTSLNPVVWSSWLPSSGSPLAW